MYLYPSVLGKGSASRWGSRTAVPASLPESPGSSCRQLTIERNNKILLVTPKMHGACVWGGVNCDFFHHLSSFPVGCKASPAVTGGRSSPISALCDGKSFCVQVFRAPQLISCLICSNFFLKICLMKENLKSANLVNRKAGLEGRVHLMINR